MKKHISIGFIISAVLIYFAFRNIEFHNILTALKEINYTWIVVLFITTFFNFYIKSYRWKILFNHPKGISSFRLMHFFTIGLMSNNFLPFRMGELVRIYITSKKINIKKSIVTATVVVERVLDVLALLLLLFLFFFLNNEVLIPPAIKRTATLLLIVFIIMFIALIISRKERGLVISIFKKLPSFKLKDKIIEKIHFFIDGLGALSHLKHLLSVISLSIIIWAIEGFGYYIMGIAFNINVNFLGFIFVMVIICLGIMIPSAPGYVGVYEASCIAGLAVFSIDKTSALTYALVLHAIQLIFITIIGIAFLWNEGLTFKDLKMEGEKA